MNKDESSRAPGLTSGLQGSVNVHRGALLLVPQWQCISSFVFYILYSLCSLNETMGRIYPQLNLFEIPSKIHNVSLRTVVECIPSVLSLFSFNPETVPISSTIFNAVGTSPRLRNKEVSPTSCAIFTYFLLIFTPVTCVLDLNFIDNISAAMTKIRHDKGQTLQNSSCEFIYVLVSQLLFFPRLLYKCKALLLSV